MLPEQKLDALIARHATLERDLAAAMPAETYVKLSREFAELDPVVEAENPIGRHNTSSKASRA